MLIPPQTFHLSMPVVVLKNNGRPVFGSEYNRKNAYLLGVFNSMTFDFLARSRLRLHAGPIIKNLPIPRNTYEDEIGTLAARLSVGHERFKELASSMGISPISLSPGERVHALAEMDALVAHAYTITRNEYKMIVESFEFGEDPSLYKSKIIDLNDKCVRKNFYGEVRKNSIRYFDKNWVK